MTKLARYDTVADMYASGWTDDLRDPVTVSLLELAGAVDGRRVLEVACGHGRVSRGLAKRGASVVGVDLSAAMLAKAAEAERHEPLGIEYLQADVSAPGLLEGEIFDVAVCSFGLSDIDDLNGALVNIKRLLRPGGVFALCILHPCFAGIDGVSGAWPTETDYYDERWWQADGTLSTLRQQVGANHRMLATYLNTLQRHGFRLDEVAEPRPKVEPDSPRAAMARYPVFLVLRCVTEAGSAGE
ncbi:methyltransferase family protein [Kribbella amoyensis]|uniref:Methyltransferase family protein n=1 Tax=Kribbella amoyensis TaxID=996641 RepID=A0A561BZP6_9ACTN|nr:class I SAM-dependent methyltransferase [Kribbella amoyensis]TWD84340.1 methyltransferase family protein [Kribbella amoyensis]